MLVVPVAILDVYGSQDVRLILFEAVCRNGYCEVCKTFYPSLILGQASN